MRHKVRVEGQKAHKWAKQLCYLSRWYNELGNPYKKSQDGWLEQRKACHQREYSETFASRKGPMFLSGCGLYVFTL